MEQLFVLISKSINKKKDILHIILAITWTKQWRNVNNLQSKVQICIYTSLSTITDYL